MTNEAENLRKRMAAIRRDVDGEVGAVVEHAKEMADWRNFVKRHPLASVGAATAIGFLLVPRRLEVMSPSSRELEKLAKRNRLVVKPRGEVKKQAGMVSPLVNFVTGAVVRSCVSLAGQHLAQLMSNDSEQGTSNPARTAAVRSSEEHP